MNSAFPAEALWLQLIDAQHLPLSMQTIDKLESGLSEPRFSLARIEPIVHHDAALAAMLLKQANHLSPEVGLDLADAVVQLGKKGIRAIIATAPLLNYCTLAMQKDYQRVLLQSTFAMRHAVTFQQKLQWDRDESIRSCDWCNSN